MLEDKQSKTQRGCVGCVRSLGTTLRKKVTEDTERSLGTRKSLVTVTRH